MDETNIITMIFYAQRDAFQMIKSTKEMKSAFNTSLNCVHKLFEAFEDHPKFKNLYEKVEKATIDYYSEVEDNTYYHGFKTGFKLAIELGLCKL